MICTCFLHDNDLPELYGNGAFPINYPNSWDKRNNKTGYGIWIHGVPRDTYSRPPLASEGCVVTSNKTLLKLKEFIHLGETKIILTEEIDWITKKEWKEIEKHDTIGFNHWYVHEHQPTFYDLSYVNKFYSN